MDTEKRIIISLGGSLIVPNEIDIKFLQLFVSEISEYIKKGFKFIIITGGGRLSRTYTLSAKEIVDPTKDDLDWIGISTTRLNAQLVRVCFGDDAHTHLIFDPTDIPDTDKPVILGGGWKPGNSSDLAAVECARSVGADTLINLSNIDYVYDKDPRYNTDALKIEDITWEDFRKLLPDEWDPGLNAPFDPVAAREAQTLGLNVVILNGRNIENLKDYLDGKNFIGTLIH